MPRFELAGGSVIGRDHRTVGRNSQDAYAIVHDDQYTVAVVADGCGSGTYSEVGAHLGVKLVAENLRAQLRTRQTINWDAATRQVLARLELLVSSMGGNYREIVEEYLLFTLVGVVLQPTNATFFGLGDGTMIINGTPLPLGPYPNNAPPYLGYGLLEGRVDVDPGLIRISPYTVTSIHELHSFLIGTDGVDDLIAHQGSRMPGTDRVVGAIDQFWEQDRYFANNPILVSRQLGLIGRDWPRANPEIGLLSDDTTIIVGKKVHDVNDSDR